MLQPATAVDLSAAVTVVDHQVLAFMRALYSCLEMACGVQ